MDRSEHLTQSPLLLSVKNIRHGFARTSLPLKERESLQAKTATAHQVHQDAIEWTSHWQKSWARADAVGTTTPGLPVGVLTADCAPILFAAIKDNAAIAVMAVHAGWRGAALEIAGQAVEALGQKAPGAQLYAAIGPTISFDVFEVGEEVIAAFPHSEALGLARFMRQEGDKRKYRFNLAGENARQIESAAARLKIPLRLELLQECTFLRRNLYPSFRRDKESAGRMLSFVELIA